VIPPLEHRWGRCGHPSQVHWFAFLKCHYFHDSFFGGTFLTKDTEYPFLSPDSRHVPPPLGSLHDSARSHVSSLNSFFVFLAFRFCSDSLLLVLSPVWSLHRSRCTFSLFTRPCRVSHLSTFHFKYPFFPPRISTSLLIFLPANWEIFSMILRLPNGRAPVLFVFLMISFKALDLPGPPDLQGILGGPALELAFTLRSGVLSNPPFRLFSPLFEVFAAPALGELFFSITLPISPPFCAQSPFRTLRHPSRAANLTFTYVHPQPPPLKALLHLFYEDFLLSVVVR